MPLISTSGSLPPFVVETPRRNITAGEETSNPPLAPRQIFGVTREHRGAVAVGSIVGQKGTRLVGLFEKAGGDRAGKRRVSVGVGGTDFQFENF